MIKKTIAFLLLFIICSLAYSQDTLQFNGTYWKNLTNEGKALYIVGLSHGEYVIQSIIYRMEEKPILEAIIKIVEDPRTIAQTIKSIDSFYKDNKDKEELPVCIVYMMMLEASKIE